VHQALNPQQFFWDKGVNRDAEEFPDANTASP
jgi:hypothetical protein